MLLRHLLRSHDLVLVLQNGLYGNVEYYIATLINEAPLLLAGALCNSLYLLL